MLFLSPKCCLCGGSIKGCCPCPNLEMTNLIQSEYNVTIAGGGMQQLYCDKYNIEHNTSIKCFK